MTQTPHPDFEAIAAELVSKIGGMPNPEMRPLVSAALAQAFEAGRREGMEARITATVSDASSRALDWAHSGPCPANCTCTLARAASLGGGK